MEELAHTIRTIPDFPKEGILFRDITPLLQDGRALRRTVRCIADRYREAQLDAVVSAESRGFILGCAVAYELGIGFIPVRKPGKLPYEVESATYELEYGTDTLEIHRDAIRPGERLLVFDDLIATGGTALAICELVERLGGTVYEVAFLIELVDLEGVTKLGRYSVWSALRLPGK